MKKLPWTSKPRRPYERALKIVSETDVKIDLAFCLKPPIEKTNSEQVLVTLISKSFHSIISFTYIKIGNK